ncbi:polar amino acid transport system permease protein [Streptosporangium becharense]|uniref:Polar amino acid transport system permease protein n=1 Tax=Streptosporangium becharense TaxID=1816182 RepID=A0A7W9ICM2_9ACTN|nr:amino acid ABC transporter permease [Streptosporangium becharense]MBB2912938.1 polar amino acid transport system permease protein [Streptosporangium becharense]MBB5818237.1 polar amino acid transport system permease protein [Streptosporangium becharense]
MTEKSTTTESVPAGGPFGRSGLSPRKRQRISRAVQYVLLIVVVAFLIWRIEWGQLAANFAKPEVAEETLPELFTIALKNTIIYSVGGFLFAFLLGLLFALMRLSSVRPYRWIAIAYIEIFRGLPALLVFLLILFLPLALPGFEVPGGTYGQGILGLTVVGSAYMAETLRAGLQAVPKGQMEAARSLGMSYSRSMVSIVIPQAVRIVIPPTTNQFVSLLKDSSLVLFLGVSGEYVELTKFGNDMASTHANATPILVVGVTYLLVTIPLGYLASLLEKRQAKGR